MSSPGSHQRWILAAAVLGSSLTFIDGSPSDLEAFHGAFRVVIAICAGCAALAGVVGRLTAPGRLPPKESRAHDHA